MYKNTKYFTKGHQFTSNIEILVMPNSSLTLLEKKFLILIGVIDILERIH